MRRDNDIKAPDGYTLGGLRLVRKDGTILFNRGYWQAPVKWAGEKVWVHEEWVARGSYWRAEEIALEAANPGLHIYEARSMGHTVICERTEKPDAKPVYRSASRKAWAARQATTEHYESCQACGLLTHIEEAACVYCGAAKPGRNEKAA